MTKQRNLDIGQEFTIRTIEKIKKDILSRLKKNPSPEFSISEIKEVDLAGLQLLEILDRDYILTVKSIQPSLLEIIQGAGFDNVINKTN